MEQFRIPFHILNLNGHSRRFRSICNDHCTIFLSTILVLFLCLIITSILLLVIHSDRLASTQLRAYNNTISDVLIDGNAGSFSLSDQLNCACASVPHADERKTSCYDTNTGTVTTSIAPCDPESTEQVGNVQSAPIVSGCEAANSAQVGVIAADKCWQHPYLGSVCAGPLSSPSNNEVPVSSRLIISNSMRGERTATTTAAVAGVAGAAMVATGATAVAAAATTPIPQSAANEGISPTPSASSSSPSWSQSSRSSSSSSSASLPRIIDPFVGALDVDIAIVGAGASGLSTAFFLLENNFVSADRITIFEKSNRTGGKIHSWQKDGRWYEKGAAHVLNFYNTTLFLLERFNITIEPITKYTVTGMDWSLFETASNIFSRTAAPLTMLFDLVDYLGFLERPQFDSYHASASFQQLTELEDLQLSLEQFLSKHSFESLKPLLYPLSYLLTSVTADKLPFGIFVKLCPPKMLKSFIHYNAWDYLHLHHFFGNVEPPGYFVPSGYQSLMDAMTDYLREKGVHFVLGHSVTSIDTTNETLPVLTVRREPSHDEAAHIDGTISKQAFDLVVFSNLYTHTDEHFNPVFIHGLPCADILHSAAKEVSNPAIFKYHVQINASVETENGIGAKVPVTDYTFMNSYGKVNTPYAAYNFAGNSAIVSTLSVITPGTSLAEMQRNIATALEVLELGPITFLSDEEAGHYICKVQPVPDASLVQKGYYTQLEQLQGVKNVYYANIHFTFSFSGLVMQYGKEVAELIATQQRKKLSHRPTSQPV